MDEKPDMPKNNWPARVSSAILIALWAFISAIFIWLAYVRIKEGNPLD